MDNHPDFDNVSLEESNEDLSDRGDTDSESEIMSDSVESGEGRSRASKKRRYRGNSQSRSKRVNQLIKSQHKKVKGLEVDGQLSQQHQISNQNFVPGQLVYPQNPNMSYQQVGGMYNMPYSQPQIQYQYIPVIQPILQPVPVFYSSSAKDLQQIKSRGTSLKKKSIKKRGTRGKRGKSHHAIKKMRLRTDTSCEASKKKDWFLKWMKEKNMKTKIVDKLKLWEKRSKDCFDENLKKVDVSDDEKGQEISNRTLKKSGKKRGRSGKRRVGSKSRKKGKSKKRVKDKRGKSHGVRKGKVDKRTTALQDKIDFVKKKALGVAEGETQSLLTSPRIKKPEFFLKKKKEKSSKKKRNASRKGSPRSKIVNSFSIKSPRDKKLSNHMKKPSLNIFFNENEEISAVLNNNEERGSPTNIKFKKLNVTGNTANMIVDAMNKAQGQERAVDLISSVDFSSSQNFNFQKNLEMAKQQELDELIIPSVCSEILPKSESGVSLKNDQGKETLAAVKERTRENSTEQNFKKSTQRRHKSILGTVEANQELVGSKFRSDKKDVNPVDDSRYEVFETNSNNVSALNLKIERKLDKFKFKKFEKIKLNHIKSKSRVKDIVERLNAQYKKANIVKEKDTEKKFERKFKNYNQSNRSLIALNSDLESNTLGKNLRLAKKTPQSYLESLKLEASMDNFSQRKGQEETKEGPTDSQTQISKGNGVSNTQHTELSSTNRSSMPAIFNISEDFSILNPQSNKENTLDPSDEALSQNHTVNQSMSIAEAFQKKRSKLRKKLEANRNKRKKSTKNPKTKEELERIRKDMRKKKSGSRVNLFDTQSASNLSLNCDFDKGKEFKTLKFYDNNDSIVGQTIRQSCFVLERNSELSTAKTNDYGFNQTQSHQTSILDPNMGRLSSATSKHKKRVRKRKYKSKRSNSELKFGNLQFKNSSLKPNKGREESRTSIANSTRTSNKPNRRKRVNMRKQLNQNIKEKVEKSKTRRRASQNPDLASSRKRNISKREMYERTKRRYNQLPEVVAKNNQSNSRVTSINRAQRAKEYDRKLRERNKSKKLRKQKNKLGTSHGSSTGV